MPLTLNSGKIKEMVEAHYEELSKIGNLGPDPSAGFLRAAFSDEETRAFHYIEQQAAGCGLSSRYDGLGNLFIERPGKQDGFVEMGSHLDTVPSGGNFDGAAGIVAGLEALRAVLESGIETSKGLRLRVWRGEESATFNSVYTGSLGAFGKLNPKNLEGCFQGRSLRQAISSQGYDPDLIERGCATISQKELDGIVAHLELHIEQGNLLEVTGKDIGIVTSIRGPKRYRVVMEGAFDHSGATPMGPRYRRDANLAIAHTLVRLDDLAARELAAGRDLVQTVGVINSDRSFNAKHQIVYDNAVPKISGYGYFCLDIRTSDNAFKASYCREAEDVIKHCAKAFGVDAAIEVLGESDGIGAMDPAIMSSTEKACQELGLSHMRIASGAGHDAAIVGQQLRSDGTKVPAGMIFIPCKAGKSHCPEEYASPEAIAKGAMVLARSLYELGS